MVGGVPVTFWARPSVATISGAEQSARPERSVWSRQEKLTATSVLFQPWAFASGDWLAMIVGRGQVDLRTVKDWRASRLPARSTDQYSTVCTPSAPTVTLVPRIGVGAVDGVPGGVDVGQVVAAPPARR